MLRRLQKASYLIRRCHQMATSSSSIFDHDICSSTGKNHQDRYDQASSLVAELNKPAPKTAESPLILPGISAIDYMKLFDEQVAIEKGCFTKVANTTRKSKLESMEQLLDQWEWKHHIEENLNLIISRQHLSKELLVYFKKLDTKKCADQLLIFLKAILCRGQKAIPITEFHSLLPRIILKLHGDFFYKVLEVDHKKKLEMVFEEYIKYYTDENIARNHTIREWWYKCTNMHDVSASCHPLFEDFFKTPIREITHMLLNFLIGHCEFPVPRSNKFSKNAKKRKFKYRPAFSIKDIPIYEMNPHSLSAEWNKIGKKTDFCKMLVVDHYIPEYCQKHQFEFLYFPSHLLPMKVPPRPWLDKGKYGPNYTFKQNLIRRLDEFPEMDVNMEMLDKRIANKEQARPVFDSLNILGAIPWKINEEMLGHLMTALEMSYDSNRVDFLKRLDIPRHPSSILIPPEPEPDFEAFKKKYRKRTGIQKENDRLIEDDIEKEYEKYCDKIIENWEKQRDEKLKIRSEQNSLWCWLMYRLILAKHFADQTIYFPHNLDFRGRTYPISPQINHMGDDLNRGLLKFAKGKPLGENGFRWLKLHCINITGKMKRQPLRDRLKYAEKHIDEIIHSAEKPFEKGSWWMDSEEPWQTLATCIEIRDALKGGDPHKFCSHLPIHQDGSCNGLQHYAALGRDLKGAKEVNLLPEDRPQDIYSTVAESVEQMRIRDENNEQATDENAKKDHEIAKALREYMKGPLERKIIKQTVMTTVYGVTAFGAREQIKRQLADLKVPKDKAAEFKKHLGKFSAYLARRTFDGITEAFKNSKDIMNWFKECAAQVLKLRRPMEWVTPLGLPVIQPYVRIEKLGEQLCFLPVRHKQKNAFPPNFVHSLDSTHMMLTTLYCHRMGITFAAVHDCYWTHACDVDQMNEICREQFIALHNEPIIQKLSESFYTTYLTPDLREKMAANFIEEMEEKFKLSIEPGELDINQVRDSIYFFS